MRKKVCFGSFFYMMHFQRLENTEKPSKHFSGFKKISACVSPFMFIFGYVLGILVRQTREVKSLVDLKWFMHLF